MHPITKATKRAGLFAAIVRSLQTSSGLTIPMPTNLCKTWQNTPSNFAYALRKYSGLNIVVKRDADRNLSLAILPMNKPNTQTHKQNGRSRP